MALKLLVHSALAGAGLACVGTGAAQDRQDASQAEAIARQERGQNLPAREIERRTVPQMRGAQYLGFDYDPNTNIYTLKFLRNGSVIWVDVSGRSGRVLRRTGN